MKPFKIFLFIATLLVLAFAFSMHSTFNENGNVIELTEQNSILDDSTLLNKVDTVSEIQSTINGIEQVTSLYPFFNQLKFSNDSLIRIVFFGDSQLEGDFLTTGFRDQFQTLFGGNGIGFMPAEMYFNTTQKLAIIPSGFEKHIVSSRSSETKRNYGFYGSYFTPKSDASSIRIKNRDSNHKFENLKILYSGNSNLTSNSNTDSVYKLRSASIAIQNLPFDKVPSEIKLAFRNNDSLKVFGLLFDSVSGVVVDHVPFRGSLNLMLNKYEEIGFVEMNKLLKPKLIVLQFGLNVIPDIRTDYSNYRIAFQRDIHLLKKYSPNASILVISASDMAHKVNGNMEPYPNINALIEAQKEAALNENVAFWNLRKAMGGEGIIIEWVSNDLAKTDYAHLTRKGYLKVSGL
ncbi:MAG: hypothetical protein PF541_00320, partial [Prolixibacteraceae bacterium]|nr:hypothetical protein [Prolixibacteraceae bacterium]